MNEKLSFQHIADALAQKAGVSKKVSDSFTKAFFETIVDALYMGEESIRIKGLGTFKLVEVGSRESVNVSNGERIVIPGYKKVSFTPEEAVVDFLNRTAREEATEVVSAEEVPVVVEEKPVVEEVVPVVEEQPVAEESVHDAPVVEEVPMVEKQVEKAEESPVKEEDVDIETLIAVPAPAHVEQAQDEFSGIDLLISTPESVEEVRAQYEAAKEKMEAVVEEARKANAEKMRLEKLLERLEANVVPEAAEQPAEDSEAESGDDVSATSGSGMQEEAQVPADEPEVTGASLASMAADEKSASSSLDEEERRRQALERYLHDAKPEAQQEPETKNPPKKRSYKAVWLTQLVLLFVAVIAYFLYQTSRSIEAVERVSGVEQVAKSKKEMGKPAVAKSKAPKSSSVKSAPAPSAQDKPSQGASKPQMKSTADALQPAKPASAEKSTKKEEEKTKRPSTYVLQKGESLTRISQRFYGTKDSVRAIIRANDFANPDNVPAGAVIKLP